MDKWVPYLAQAVGELHPEDYSVGHSLGCITILRYLESLKEGQIAGGGSTGWGFWSRAELPGL